MKKLVKTGQKLLDLSTPAVMGILNITPDSFYDGGTLNSETSVLERAGKMLSEGAAIIDIGAQSTRPGAPLLDADSEWERLSVILPALKKEYPDALFSIDTFHAAVAERAVGEGCAMINDVSGGSMDPIMFSAVAKLRVPYVLMHIQGTPQTMQHAPSYENVVTEVYLDLQQRLTILHQLGVSDVIIDPGFGFGKTLEQNYQLLHQLRYLSTLDAPVLVGLSRKSMVNKVLQCTPENALNGTTVLNTLALVGGASLLRVHDVKEAVETVKLHSAFESAPAYAKHYHTAP